jgi:hypothetical protein
MKEPPRLAPLRLTSATMNRPWDSPGSPQVVRVTTVQRPYNDRTAGCRPSTLGNLPLYFGGVGWARIDREMMPRRHETDAPGGLVSRPALLRGTCPLRSSFPAQRVRLASCSALGGGNS